MAWEKNLEREATVIRSCSLLLIYHRFIECVSKVRVKTDHDYRDYHAVSRAI